MCSWHFPIPPPLGLLPKGLEDTAFASHEPFVQYLSDLVHCNGDVTAPEDVLQNPVMQSQLVRASLMLREAKQNIRQLQYFLSQSVRLCIYIYLQMFVPSH